MPYDKNGDWYFSDGSFAPDTKDRDYKAPEKSDNVKPCSICGNEWHTAKDCSWR